MQAACFVTSEVLLRATLLVGMRDTVTVQTWRATLVTVKAILDVRRDLLVMGEDLEVMLAQSTVGRSSLLAVVKKLLVARIVLLVMEVSLNLAGEVLTAWTLRLALSVRRLAPV